MDNDDLPNNDIIDNTTVRAVDNLAHRMSNPKLMALRAQNPFIHVMPFPNEVVALALQANVPTDINLPEGTKMVRFSGNGDYYVSRKGNAELPTAQNPGGGSVYKPEGAYYYTEEIKQFSVIAQNACNLTVQCFIQL